MKFNKSAIGTPGGLLFCNALCPVTIRRGLVISGSSVIPELNFTLPIMSINTHTMLTVCEHYRSIVTEVIDHAHRIHASNVIFEFDTLLEMTPTLSIGIESIQNFKLQTLKNKIHEKLFKSISCIFFNTV